MLNDSRPRSQVWFSKSVIGWILYDIGSSGYVLMVPSVAYAVYYRQTICGGESICDARWALWVSLSLVISGLLGPLLGAIADIGALRHRFFVVTTVLCSAATLVLYWVQPGAVLFGGLMFLLAHVGYLLAVSLYDAYIPALVAPSQMGRLSGLGWGLGNLGGIICYLLYLLITQVMQVPQPTAYRLSFVMVAVFLIVLAMPALLWLPRQSSSSAIAPTKLVHQAYLQVLETLRNWRQRPHVFKFLLGYYLISDGMFTITSFISIFFYTQFELGIPQILRLSLIFDLVAVPATVACGFLSDRWSVKWLLRLLLAGWIGIVMLMVFSTHPATPLVIAVSMGVVMGSTLALCRGLFAQMVHAAHATELFGFNALVSKMSAIVGPLVFGLISSSTDNQRLAMASLLVFFGAGGWVLTSFSGQPDRPD